MTTESKNSFYKKEKGYLYKYWVNKSYMRFFQKKTTKN